MQTKTTRRGVTPSQDQVLRLGAGLTGVVMLASAGLAADLAAAHMSALGAICGAGSTPHCGWCFGAASLALAGLAAFALALDPRRPFRVDPAQGRRLPTS